MICRKMLLQGEISRRLAIGLPQLAGEREIRIFSQGKFLGKLKTQWKNSSALVEIFKVNEHEHFHIKKR